MKDLDIAQALYEQSTRITKLAQLIEDLAGFTANLTTQCLRMEEEVSFLKQGGLRAVKDKGDE